MRLVLAFCGAFAFAAAQRTYTYDAVSIHRSDPMERNVRITEGPQGGIRTINTSTLLLITAAWHLDSYRVIGASGWVSKDRYDVTFTPGESEAPPPPDAGPSQSDTFFDHNMLRLQGVLRDRFGLVVHTDSREMPIFSLAQAKSGNKLKQHPPDGPGQNIAQNGDRQIRGTNATVSMLCAQLGMLFGRPVHDDTHLGGRYDFRLDWVPDAAPAAPSSSGAGQKPELAPAGPSIFTAIQEQLGLRLDSTKGPVSVLVIDRINPPSEN